MVDVDYEKSDLDEKGSDPEQGENESKYDEMN